MPRPTDYRQRLLIAAALLAKRTPTTIRRARRILRECHATLVPYTLANLIWGPNISALQELLVHDNPERLLSVQESIQASTGRTERAYVRYDFRNNLSRAESELYAALLGMLNFLDRFPFADAQLEINEYQRKVEEIRALVSQLPIHAAAEDETIYSLVLRETSSAVTSINMTASVLRYRYMVPNTPYSTIDDGYSPPNLRTVVEGARRAMQAISGEEWLAVTWRFAGVVVMSIH